VLEGKRRRNVRGKQKKRSSVTRESEKRRSVRV